MKSIKILFLVLIFALISACGRSSGGGGGGNTSTAFVSKGPITGGTCYLKNLTNDSILASASPNKGKLFFSSSTSGYIECVGGIYTDEVTGGTRNAPIMRGVGTVVTPLTDIAYQIANSNGDISNAASIAQSIADQFGLDGVDITSVQPTDLNTTTAKNDNAGKYGLILAALAKMGGDDIVALITALKNDLRDGSYTNIADLTNALSDLGNADERKNSEAIASIIEDLGGTPTITPNPLKLTSSNILSIDENSAVSYTAVVSGATTVIWTLQGTDASYFNFTTAGVLSSKANPDYETKKSYNIDLKVTDGTNTLIESIAITVKDLNDNVPILSSNGAIDVLENRADTGYVAQATDADANSVLAFTAIGGADLSKFNTALNAGKLLFKAGAFVNDKDSNNSPDFENKQDANADNIYEVIIQVSDRVNTATKTVKITITNVNDVKPEITSGASVTVAENNTATGYTATATDSDSVGNITFKLESAVTSNFTITSAGVLSFKTAPDYEISSQRSFTAKIIATDGVQDSDVKTVTVNVTDVNDNKPVIADASSITVSEGEAINFSVKTMTATDVDTGTTYSNWSIVSGNDRGNVFQINASTGEITLRDTLEYESFTNYSLGITVSDGVNTSAVKILIVNVGDENDNRPVFLQGTTGYNVDVLENHVNTGYVATAIDDDANTVIVFTAIGGADLSKFNTTLNAGKLLFKAGAFVNDKDSNNSPDFENKQDANADNVYEVILKASDGLHFATKTIKITVTDTNNEFIPVFTSGDTVSVSIVEGETNTTHSAIATDLDTSDNIVYSIVNGLDGNSFFIGNTTGSLTFRNAPDYEDPKDLLPTDNVYVVQVQATDGVNPVFQTITVTIIDKNDTAPVFTSSATFNVDENVTGSVLTLNSTDADTTTEVTTYSISGGADKDLFSLAGANLSFKVSPDFEDGKRIHNLTVKASDGTNETTQQITIYLQDLNDNKPIVASATVTLAENANVDSLVTTLNATDADADTRFVNWTIVSGDDSNNFSINSLSNPRNEAYITINESFDFETKKSYTLGVTVGDGSNTSELITIQVNITDVNDTAPVWVSGNSVDVNENETNTTYRAVATDEDTVGTITYSLSDGGDDSDKFNITAAGSLSFNNAPDFENPTDNGGNNIYEVQIEASDGVSSAFQMVNVTVLPLNDSSPTIATGQVFSALESLTIGSGIGVVRAFDNDNDTLSNWKITSGNDETVFAINTAGSLTISGALDYETTAQYILGLTVDSEGETSQETTITINIIDVSPNISDMTTTVFHGVLNNILFNVNTSNIVIETNSAYGETTIDSSDNKVTITYYTDEEVATDSFVIKATFDDETATALISVNIANDPLYQFQWHLKNTGQTAFARNAGTIDADLNMADALKRGLTGKGVQIAVVDSGLEIAHEDLSDNIENNKSCDFVGSHSSNGGSINDVNGCSDKDPTTTETTGDHGTSVSGLIASTGWNDKGGRGVAPNAKLRGFNLIETGVSFVSYFVIALGGKPFTNDIAIFNQSYGSGPTAVAHVNSTINAQYWDGVTNLRSGKGAIYVKSSGNGFTSRKNVDCAASSAASISCENSNMDPTNAQYHQIVVGAVNADNKISSYSTWGSSVWVSAYGGESGINLAQYGLIHPTPQKPAMVTTDQSTCAKGYTSETVTLNEISGRKATPFHDTTHIDNQTHNSDCNYASTFNGTSSAAPVLSGAIALMLEVNSSLTWRQIKYILAKTSKQIDSAISAKTYNLGGAYVGEEAWITNDAGFKFHNAYGFGKVDIDEAIKIIDDNAVPDLGNLITTDWVSSTGLVTPSYQIPDNSATGLSNTINITTNNTIEAVQIEVDVSHTYVGDIGIELISPNNTRNVLFTIKNGFGASDNLKDMQLLSNAFYGESSNGNWTIKVVDSSNGNIGVLKSWKIRFYGHN